MSVLVLLVPLAFIFGIIFEFLAELILGPIIEGILHLIARFLRWSLRKLGLGARWVRRLPLLVDVVFAFASVALGWWWGSYVESTGQQHPPIALWSLLATFIVSGVLAATGAERDSTYPVFRVNRARLTRFATLNLAGAIGVALGFSF